MQNRNNATHLVPEGQRCTGVEAVACKVVECNGALGEGRLPAQTVGHRQGLNVTCFRTTIGIFDSS